VWDCFLWESFRTRGQLIAPPTNMTIVQQGENGAAGTDGSGGPPATQRVSSTRSAISSALTSAREALASATSSTPVVMMNGIPAPGSGFTFLFRVALGILAMYTDVLRTAGFEECLYFLQHLPGKPSAASAARESMLDSGVEASSMDLEQLFACIREVKMDEKIWKDNTGRTARHVRAMYVPHQIISPRPSTQQQQQQQQQLHARADSKPDFSGYGSPTVSPNV
jgi:hypothetical protein